MRQQIVRQITTLGTTTRTRTIIAGVEDGSATEETVSVHPYRAADYLDVMAGEPASSGLSEAGNIGVVVDALRAETRRLRAGPIVPGGGSNAQEFSSGTPGY
jgi:hypothetical protein